MTRKFKNAAESRVAARNAAHRPLTAKDEDERIERYLRSVEHRVLTYRVHSGELEDVQTSNESTAQASFSIRIRRTVFQHEPGQDVHHSKSAMQLPHPKGPRSGSSAVHATYGSKWHSTQAMNIKQV